MSLAQHAAAVKTAPSAPSAFDPRAVNIKMGHEQMTVPAAVNNLRMTQRWLRVQSLVALLLALIAYPLAGPVAAYSAFFGGLAAFLPALLFALIVARRFGAESTRFLRAAVLAEALKWLLCAVICVAVFVGVKPLAAGWFFAGMGLVIMAGWLGLIGIGFEGFAGNDFFVFAALQRCARSLRLR